MKDSGKEQQEQPKQALAEGELTDEQLEQASGGTGWSQLQSLKLQNSMQQVNKLFSSVQHVQKAGDETASSIAKNLK